jgi:hypothetical protein
MTRINAIRNIRGSRDCVAWGKIQSTIRKASASPLVFAAALIVCSMAVGCSSDKPKLVNSNNQMPATGAQRPIAPSPAPVMQAENKPAPKKVVHRKPATVNYTDKTYGVSFEYPRRYAIETGDAATSLLVSSPLPMNFVAPGGVALAAVELPETGFINTDFSSAYFDVSVNKTLTADQCAEFAVPEPKVTPVEAGVSQVSAGESASQNAAAQNAPTQGSSNQLASTQVAADQSASNQPSSTQAALPADAQSSPTQAGNAPATAPVAATAGSASSVEPQGSKLMLGDLELRGIENVSGEGTRQNDSKYFHVFQNGACYEFALNVTTVASDQGMTKHVDRDRVFNRLERILSTVKINAMMPEASAETPAATAVSTTPAQ